VLLQLTSIAGAVLVLAAYAAHQAGRMSRETAAYHVINAGGGALLLVAAVATRQIGSSSSRVPGRSTASWRCSARAAAGTDRDRQRRSPAC
jgi:ABC-type enterobactin transport system permease subunit